MTYKLKKADIDLVDRICSDFLFCPPEYSMKGRVKDLSGHLSCSVSDDSSSYLCLVPPAVRVESDEKIYFFCFESTKLILIKADYFSPEVTLFDSFKKNEHQSESLVSAIKSAFSVYGEWGCGPGKNKFEPFFSKGI